jgi:diaminohydroxyphosphoribosylaminopyrimidine deaminase / 5-amino-6-(5-phosphoribosylamino)uracil reductase
MNRCLQLAQLGAGYVAPNPMVGAVLRYKDTIIGEGYHQKFGEPHAEVNCIKSVTTQHQPLIKESTLYISLEPCSHFGKTPPCTHLIIDQQIPEVIIACRDPFEKVNGHGIELLKKAGILVTEAVLENEAKELNKRFFTFYQKKRPYIFLKWAQSADGFIAGENFEVFKISNDFTNRFTHHMRSTEAAIMVGSHTARQDNPSLTTRFWPGKNPVRIVMDKQLQLANDAALFADNTTTIVLNDLKQEIAGPVHFIKLNKKEPVLLALMNELYLRNINSLIIEGGSILLQSFIQEGLWDEAIVITNHALTIHKGIAALSLPADKQAEKFNLLSDDIKLYKNN